jgi:hypothetical protein
MRSITPAVAIIGIFALVSPSLAIYQEPNVPHADNSEAIPGKSVKLDQDGQPASDNKTPRQAKPRERDSLSHQTARKPSREEQTERGMSPEASRALGTAIGIGLGVGMMGFGRRGGDDRGISGGRFGDR